jgi:hypothetical protein
MAVAFDAVSSNSGAGNSRSWTHTPVGTPTSVGVAFHVYDGAGTATVTYGGLSLTKFAAATSASVGGNPNHTEIWGSDGQTLPTGAQTVLISFSGSDFCEAGAVTVTGSDTTTCFSNGGNNSDGAGSTAVSVTTTSATGELVLEVTGNSAVILPTVTGGQTSRWGVAGWESAGATQAGAASVTPTWSLSSANSWTASAASFKAAGGGGGTRPRTLTMLGVG